MTPRQDPEAPVKSLRNVTASSKISRVPSRNILEEKIDDTFSLRDVNVENVKRAQALRSDDPLRYKKFCNYFSSYDKSIAREIDRKTSDVINNWINETMGPEVLSCVSNEKKKQWLVLIIVSAALAKYGEKTLIYEDNLGNMDDLVSTHFRTYALRSKEQQEYRKTHKSPQSHKKHVAHTVGLGLVLDLNLRLPPEKRVESEAVKEILNHRSNMRLLLISTNLGLHKNVDIALQSRG